MACGCGKTREERMAERQERAQRLREASAARKALRAQRDAERAAAQGKAS